MPAVEDQPTVTTSNLPPKSFMDSPEFEKSIEDALAADAKTRGPGPDDIAPVKAPVPATDPKPPTPEVKPAEATPQPAKPGDEDEIPADIKSPGAQSSWKKLKESKNRIEGERDTIRKERDTLKADFEALKKTASTPAEKKALADEPEYQQLKALVDGKTKELEDYKVRLREADVSLDPQFQGYFNNKTETVKAELVLSVGKERADALWKIIELPEGEYKRMQLADAVAELDEFQRDDVKSSNRNLRSIQMERSVAIAEEKTKGDLRRVEREQQQKQQVAQQRETLERTLKQVRDNVTDKEKGLAAFQERDGDEEWNRGVRERLAIAEHAFSGTMKPEDFARNVYWGAAAPSILQQLVSEKAESAAKIADLEKTISSLRAVNPNPGGDKPGENDTPTQSTKTGLDAMMESIGQVLPGPR